MGTLIQPGGSGVLLLDPGEGSPNRVENVPVGQSSPAWSASTDANSVKMSPDGRFIVGDRDITGDDVVVLDGTNGAMVATVPTPAGATLCRSANWWSDDELVVDCQVGASVDVWRYSLSTRTMTRVSRASADYTGAYPSSVGVVVQHSSGCDSVPLGILSRDGTKDTPVAAPSGLKGAGVLVAVVGTTAYLLYITCNVSNGPSAYVAYDLVTHGAVTLVDASNQAFQGWITLR